MAIRGLMLRDGQDDWRQRGLCVGDLDPDRWFPVTGRGLPRALRETCAACPVLTQCRARGVETTQQGALIEEFGVWGGLNIAERRRIAKTERKAACGG